MTPAGEKLGAAIFNGRLLSGRDGAVALGTAIDQYEAEAHRQLVQPVQMRLDQALAANAVLKGATERLLAEYLATITELRAAAASPPQGGT